jgi:hypothetical protein
LPEQVGKHPAQQAKRAGALIGSDLSEQALCLLLRQVGATVMLDCKLHREG